MTTFGLILGQEVSGVYSSGSLSWYIVYRTPKLTKWRSPDRWPGHIDFIMRVPTWLVVYYLIFAIFFAYLCYRFLHPGKLGRWKPTQTTLNAKLVPMRPMLWFCYLSCSPAKALLAGRRSLCTQSKCKQGSGTCTWRRRKVHSLET